MARSSSRRTGSSLTPLADSQANVRGLANNQVVPDTFTYVVSDGQTYTQTTTQTVTNLITQSEAFNVAPWVSFSSGTAPVITANVAAGPNGGASTADEVTLTSANSGLYDETNVSGTYTFSVWVKLVSGSGSFALNYYSGSTNTSDTETITATSTWQQVSLTFTGDGNTNSNVALIHDLSQSTSGSFEFWGAELNPGSTIEPYVATTGSAVTTTVTTTTPRRLQFHPHRRCHRQHPGGDAGHGSSDREWHADCDWQRAYQRHRRCRQDLDGRHGERDDGERPPERRPSSAPTARSSSKPTGPTPTPWRTARRTSKPWPMARWCPMPSTIPCRTGTFTTRRRRRRSPT